MQGVDRGNSYQLWKESFYERHGGTVGAIACMNYLDALAQ